MEEQRDGLLQWRPETFGQRILWFVVGGSFFLGPGLLLSRGLSIMVVICALVAASAIVYAHASGSSRAVYRKILWGAKIYLLIALALLVVSLCVWLVRSA